MKRWHEDYRIAFREWKKHWLNHVEQNIESSRVHPYDPFEVSCVCDTQVGRFRKKDAHDCGQTRCRVCHYDKFIGRRCPTRGEIKSDLLMREGLEEINL